MKRHWILRVLKFVLFAVLFISVLSFVVMSLWNWLMPALFGFRLISYWQAVGILILSKILFGASGPFRSSAVALASAHDRALGADDSRGTREVPPRAGEPLAPVRARIGVKEAWSMKITRSCLALLGAFAGAIVTGS